LNSRLRQPATDASDYAAPKSHPPLAWLRRRILGISPDEASFARRGFRETEPSIRLHLEDIGRTFLRGYNAALSYQELTALSDCLNNLPLETRGFAFEGAAMGLSLLDCFTPWRNTRLQSFLNGPGRSHVYMVHVGVGWTLARLRLSVEKTLSRMDPLLRWLVIDGFGFHQGYFYWRRYVEEQAQPGRLSGYANRAFDQGLGRSLWFIGGADARYISATVQAFPKARQADIWSGVGLACAYAGGTDEAGLITIRDATGPYVAHLAQGAAFAAKTRLRANNIAPHTERACETFCNFSAESAAAVTDVALEGLPPDGVEPAYEVWRARIQKAFSRLES
jgi:hypothetical protein